MKKIIQVVLTLSLAAGLTFSPTVSKSTDNTETVTFRAVDPGVGGGF